MEFKYMQVEDVPKSKTGRSPKIRRQLEAFLKSGAPAAEVDFQGEYLNAQSFRQSAQVILKRMGAEAVILVRKGKAYIVRKEALPDDE